MMKLYSVFDKQVSAFMPLFPARARGEAIRMVTDAALAENGQFSKHLADYDLYEIGVWDDSVGRVIQEAEHPLRLFPLLEARGE